MGKRNITIIFITAAMCLAGAALYSVEDVIVFPELGHRKPAVIFNHKAHTERYGTRCVDCHHSGKQSKCSMCHLRRDQGSIINLKDAFHQTCHDCHRKTSGPKICTRCHRGAAR